MTLPGPSKVSPLIRFFRYTFLIAGIVYGAARYKALQIIESGRKEEKERLKAERDAKIANERKAASERDIAEIVAIFSVATPKFKVEEQSYENASKDDIKACIVDDNENKTFQSVNEADTAPAPDQCEIFSKPIDLSEHPSILNSSAERKSTGATSTNKQPDADFKAEEEHEYFVETFKNGVPYAEPQNEKYDFTPKKNK